ncbi:MAG: hypothetical protein AABW59_01285 [archaeon]|mgnify:CR=1 FL=1
MKLAAPVFLAALLALVFLGGCLGTQSDTATFNELSSLKQKYDVVDKFSSDQSVMNDYISALSRLRGKSSMMASRVIDSELESAQTLYYLFKALDSSSSFSYDGMRCESKEVLATRDYVSLSISYADKAISLMSSLGPDDIAKLRLYQLDSVREYRITAIEIKDSIESACGEQ